MREDPIVAEIRKFRAEHAARHGHDLDRICDALRKKQAKSGRKIVSRAFCVKKQMLNEFFIDTVAASKYVDDPDFFDRKLELPGSRSQAGAWVQAKIRSRFPQNTVQRLGGFQLNPHELGKSHRDYRNGGGKVLHTLKTIDFIGRLIRHIPPHYFNVIRHFGKPSKKEVQGNH